MTDFTSTNLALLAGLAIALTALAVVVVRRKKAEIDLRLSEERFRLLADNVVDYGIFMLDRDGLVASWNPGAERIKGYRADEIIGSHFSRFYPREDIDDGKPMRELTEALQSGRAVDEGWRVRKDGSRFWASVVVTALRDVDGNLRGFGKLTRDITDRKRAEDALRAEAAAQASGRARSEHLLETREAALRGILESAMDAIITVDERHNIVLFNAAAERLFGCPREQALGTPLVRFIPQRFRERHDAHVRNFGKSGITSRRMGAQRIVAGLRADGTEFPLDASISQLLQDGQRLFTVILRDVTARVRADQDLSRSREELRQLGAAGHSAREQEKMLIARELHDELGQALTALKMDVAWLEHELAAPPAAVSAKLAAMKGLLDGTTAATRRISANLRPAVLDDLGFVPAVEWLVQSFNQHSQIACELDIGNPDLKLGGLHASAAFRIIQESLTNIAKHSRATLAEISIGTDEANVTIAVRDNGSGFDQSNPRKANSFGLLGLRERVYLLDGTIAIDSSPGNGTAISILIPIASQDPRP